MATLLALSGLDAGYADLTVLRDITLTLVPGQILCVTGRNGVGKSTLMKSIAGILPPRRGSISYADTDIGHLAPYERRRLGLSYAPQDDVVFATLSVRENLTLHVQSHDLGRYAALFERFPRIGERLDQIAGTLSGGERKILSFCRVMAEGGRLICLDEPSEGVQPENISHMADVIREVARSGAGLLVVEQNLTLVESIADHVVVIDHGTIVHEQPAGETLRDEIIKHLKV